MPAMMPWRSDWAPRVGLTVWTDCRVSSTGRAPAFSTVARSFASCSVKLPVISPLPVITPFTTGFEMIVRSTAIAIWFWGGCAFNAARVASSNFAEPVPLSWNVTTHCVTPVFGSLLSCAEAFVMSLPVMITGPSWTLSFCVSGYQTVLVSCAPGRHAFVACSAAV